MSDILEWSAQLLDGHILLCHGVIGSTDVRIREDEAQRKYLTFLVIRQKSRHDVKRNKNNPSTFHIPYDSLGTGSDRLQVLIPPKDSEFCVAYFDRIKLIR